MEKWCAVVGYEGFYEVSSQGRVRSLDRVLQHYTGSTFVRAGRLLTPCPGPHGYPQVTLCREGRAKTALVHRVVAAAFHGPRPPGLVVRHLDGRQANCTADNLEYGTNVENAADMTRHGTRRVGERHPRAKLKAAQVLAIRAQRYVKTERTLAAEYKVSPQLIERIHQRIVWAHLSD